MLALSTLGAIEVAERLPVDYLAASLLARRNGARLNDVVQARHVPEAWAEDGGIDTEVDLLIDRLHEISDPQQ